VCIVCSVHVPFLDYLAARECWARSHAPGSSVRPLPRSARHQDREEKLPRCGADDASGTAGKTNWQPRGPKMLIYIDRGVTKTRPNRTRDEQFPIPIPDFDEAR
jgi:hypothetical protein